MYNIFFAICVKSRVKNEMKAPEEEVVQYTVVLDITGCLSDSEMAITYYP